MDLAKIQAAAAFATVFFSALSIAVRIALAVMFIGLLVLGFLVQPETTKE